MVSRKSSSSNRMGNSGGKDSSGFGSSGDKDKSGRQANSGSSGVTRRSVGNSRRDLPDNGRLLPLPDKRLPELRQFLDPLVGQVEEPGYIASDPVAFMHLFNDMEDNNLAGFIAALMAWGRRDIVMAKVGNLLERFGTNPADFIGNLSSRDEQRLEDFRHRTFTADDVRWLLRALSRILSRYGSFEQFWVDCHIQSQTASSTGNRTGYLTESCTVSHAENSTKNHAESCKDNHPEMHTVNHADAARLLTMFHERFFGMIPEAPHRVRKHLATPAKNSSCKRLWLFLRWTIRRNSCVDPGTMSFMPPSGLMIPLDVHVARYARMFGLLTRRANDWKAVEELTMHLRHMDASDPAKYDYALFGLGIRDIPIPPEFVINPCG
jgi:uncharacterized protein (TIGR02757 family)